ncbi:MAG: IS66 family insertion sequence element accessory protein TnpB [Eggerthellaceae bacterium]|nr:IS66 family insertion sequence element accessory protein TnpB [Eggerthellaceae bacterium]
MFALTSANRYFLYPYPTDMRKSFYTLSGIVTSQMGMNVQGGDAFIFANRRLTSLKVLHAEYGGLVIYNLKLERGTLSLPDLSDDDTNAAKRKMDFAGLLAMVKGSVEDVPGKGSRWKPKK